VSADGWELYVGRYSTSVFTPEKKKRKSFSHLDGVAKKKAKKSKAKQSEPIKIMSCEGMRLASLFFSR